MHGVLAISSLDIFFPLSSLLPLDGERVLVLLGD